MQVLRVRRGSQLYFTSRLWRLNFRFLQWVARSELALNYAGAVVWSQIKKLAVVFDSTELQRRVAPGQPSLPRSQWPDQAPIIPPFRHFH